MLATCNVTKAMTMTMAKAMSLGGSVLAERNDSALRR
ncbi:hypothetical protein AWZ03_015228, partial [Drosophila navojoa]